MQKAIIYTWNHKCVAYAKSSLPNSSKQLLAHSREAPLPTRWRIEEAVGPLHYYSH